MSGDRELYFEDIVFGFWKSVDKGPGIVSGELDSAFGTGKGRCPEV